MRVQEEYQQQAEGKFEGGDTGMLTNITMTEYFEPTPTHLWCKYMYNSIIFKIFRLVSVVLGFYLSVPYTGLHQKLLADPLYGP
jgi:hypothetical protein